MSESKDTVSGVLIRLSVHSALTGNRSWHRPGTGIESSGKCLDYLVGLMRLSLMCCGEECYLRKRGSSAAIPN